MGKKYRDKEWLREQYIEKGKDTSDIAAVCNVSNNTIRTWLKRFDIERQYKYKDKEWLKEKTDEELWQEEIGEICGVSGVTIGNWQRKYNIEANHRKKDHKQFLEEVQAEVGGEYTVLEQYIYSGIKVLMRHNKCGNEWKITPAKFLTGRRCPECRRKKRIAKITKPQEQFEGEVKDIYENEYTVLGEYKNADTKILIRHNKCGFEYKIKPVLLVKADEQWGECPVCNLHSKSMDTRAFKNSVKDLVNDEYTVLGDYEGSQTSISIRHNNCGNIYDVAPDVFLQGSRCPKCSKEKRIDKQSKTQEKFNREVKDLVGKKYTVLGDYKNANTKILIRHNEGCGCEYKVKPTSFLQGNRCPKCQLSKGENKIDIFLDGSDIPYKKEHRFEGCRDKLQLPFDFGIKDSKGNIIALIEFDGRHHYDKNNYFNLLRQTWKERVLHDHVKDQFALSNNIPLLRVNYMDRDNGTLVDKVGEFLVENNILTNQVIDNE